LQVEWLERLEIGYTACSMTLARIGFLSEVDPGPGVPPKGSYGF